MGIISTAFSEASDDQLAAILRDQDDEELALIFRALTLEKQAQYDLAYSSAVRSHIETPAAKEKTASKAEKMKYTPESREKLLDRLAVGATRSTADLNHDLGADYTLVLRGLERDGIVERLPEHRRSWRRRATDGQ